MLCIECNTHAAISLREAPLNSALAPQISCAPLWRWPLFQKCTDALPRVSVSQIARHCLARDSIRLRFVNLCSWREGGSVRGGGLAGRSVCVCVGGGGLRFVDLRALGMEDTLPHAEDLGWRARNLLRPHTRQCERRISWSRDAIDRRNLVETKKTRIKGEIWEKVGCDIWEKWVGGRKTQIPRGRGRGVTRSAHLPGGR